MSRAGKLTAIVLSTTLSLVVVEVVLRSFFPRRTLEVLTGFYPAMFEGSDYLPYRLKENFRGRLASTEFDTSVRINSLGYRDDEFAVDKGSALRVLAIGDSFTFGWGVEAHETYAAHLERLLSPRFPSKTLHVINGGFAACYSPDTYYLYLKTEGLALKPDLVVVGLFVGNDLDSSAAFENEWNEKDAEGLPLRIRNVNQHVDGNFLVPRIIPFRYRAPLLSRSHVFQGVFDIWWEIAPKIRSWMPGGTATTVHAASQEPPRPEDQIPYMYRLQYADRTETVLARVRQLLSGMNRLAKNAGVPMYVVLIPDPLQMNPNEFSGTGDIDKPQRVLGRFFETEGITHLDLLPWLREKSAGRPVYFPFDGHWNALGNELAAERIAQFVADHWPVQ
jgi:lysophospholipase L1-like esterase